MILQELYMKAWDERILELIERSESDSLFVKFLEDVTLMNSPIVIRQEESSTEYDFPEIGVSLLSSNKMIRSATFFLNSYANKLPFDLPKKSSREKVHELLGTPSRVNSVALPFTEAYRSESHDLEEFSVIFWYLSTSDELESIIVYHQGS